VAFGEILPLFRQVSRSKTLFLITKGKSNFMDKRSRSKTLKRLRDAKESVAYIQERIRMSKGIDLEILNKHLQYALLKEEELCKRLTENTSLTKSTNLVLNTI
jgi:hypothetical protein